VIRVGKCDLCLRKRTLVVDHCHSTNMVRGHLCRQCNSAMQQRWEIKAWRERAIAYLSRDLGIEYRLSPKRNATSWKRPDRSWPSSLPKGEELTRLRMERLISSNELAKKAKVTPQAITRWEKGQGRPHPRTARLVFHALTQFPIIRREG
jgi:DNA-binding XRE family transcriptional regulator